MSRIKERNRRRVALSDRKSAASQARMKNIATLAADERVPKKRRKNGGGELLRLSFTPMRWSSLMV
jgi:actin-related protein 5